MNRNLRLLGFGVAIRMLGNALYSPFLALFLVNVLHIGYFEVGVIIAGVGVALLPFNWLGGLATDRLGRRRLILLGLLGEVAATAGLAYAFALHSLAGAILAALLGGGVATTAGPAYSAYIADFAEGPERTRGFTWYRIGFNAGYSAGVTIGGLLISLIGFAGAVGVAAIVIGGGTAFLFATLEPSPRDHELGPRRRAESKSSTPPSPSKGLKASFVTLARDKVALEVLLAVGFAALVAGQWAVIFPLYVHNVLGISYALLGAGLALNGLVVVFGQSFTTESMIGRRHTTIAILGLALYVVAFVGLGAAGWLRLAPVVAFFAGVVILTIGENLITIPQATLPSNLAPREETGSYNGAFAMVGGAGFIVSVLVGGLVLASVTNPLLVWVFLVLPAVPAIVLFRHAAHRLPLTVDRA